MIMQIVFLDTHWMFKVAGDFMTLTFRHIKEAFENLRPKTTSKHYKTPAILSCVTVRWTPIHNIAEISEKPPKCNYCSRLLIFLKNTEFPCF